MSDSNPPPPSFQELIRIHEINSSASKVGRTHSRGSGIAGGLDEPSHSDKGEEDAWSVFISGFQMGGPSSVHGVSDPPPTQEVTPNMNTRIRHQHSQSMDGSTMVKSEVPTSSGEEPSAESRKAISTAKLAELAVIDPKHAKRYTVVDEAEGEKNCNTNPSSHMEENKFKISLDDLKLQFGKPLDEAARILGVSRSTLKRIRKSYDINRWPSHKKNKVNQSLFMKKNLNDAPHTTSSEADSAHPILPTEPCIPPTHDLQAIQHRAISGDNEVDKFVTIKASYGASAFIKFKLNTRSTMQDLHEQVTKRLKWEANRFEINYQDEAKDWITIIIDEDLKDCLQASIDRFESTISMSINLKLG